MPSTDAKAHRSPLRVPLTLAVVALASLRLCHLRVLWADEDYHLAAAIQMLHGRIPYRDFWYDKPPLNALYYLLIGGYSGWPLRLLDASFVLLSCWLIFRLARAWWGEREAYLAALLLAFFLAFYLPSAVVAFAADALMLAPHIAAVLCAFTRRPLLAGVFCAAAFLFNAKALFAVAACALLLWGSLPAFLLGFTVPLAAALSAGYLCGALAGYWEQVWRWGWLYTAGSPVTHPLQLGVVRTLDWLGFHAALAAGTAYWLLRGPRHRRYALLGWLALSYAAVCLGTRFAPHYFLQLLPPLVLASSKGIVLAWDRYRYRAAALLALALLVPFIRFGPRYVSLAYDAIVGRPPAWIDAAMDNDSRNAARLIQTAAKPGDTLFVWGYRPDLYVYTRLVSDGRFWDSQPLTGVPADRHLKAGDPIYSGPAARNRAIFVRSSPTWFVDGLGPLNPRLAPALFPDMRAWLAHYRPIAQTKLCVIYRRID